MATIDSGLEALATARSEFAGRLAQVTDAAWSNPTPCAGWNVREVVNHMLVGDRMTLQMLEGVAMPVITAALDDDLVTDVAGAQASFGATADAVHAAFWAEGALDGTIHHLVGEIPRSIFIGLRVSDYAVHAWDLARGLGVDDQLDSDLVDWLWQDCQPIKEILAASGNFGDGPSGTLAEAASVQDRYLDTLGRRP